jgi:hypothetical protein
MQKLRVTQKTLEMKRERARQIEDARRAKAGEPPLGAGGAGAGDKKAGH